jgi:hypothetical protein
MSKNYISITLLSLLFSATVSAQDTKDTSKKEQEKPFESLSIYPNPSVSGKVSIISNNNEDKEIIIFNAIGKIVMQTVITARELNVSSLSPGVYVIKISEGEQRATRKLIIK